MIIWSYGVTTVPQRRDNLLPRTLTSLYRAGWPVPRLFVDGSKDLQGWEKQFGLEVTVRGSNLKTFGNWILSLWELYIRNPLADRFALFQDDVVTYRNTRQYLDRLPYPERGYLNLYTFMENESIPLYKPRGFHEALPLITANAQRYHGKQQQGGRSATALVFNRPAVQALLASHVVAGKPCSATYPTNRVDGAVVEALNQAGFREYVHNPSLVQHTGELSSMGHNRGGKSIYEPARSFLGEEYDALELLAKRHAEATP